MIDRNQKITEAGNNYDAESSNVDISKRDASRLNNRDHRYHRDQSLWTDMINRSRRNWFLMTR